MTAHARQRGLEAIEQQHAVGQAGERIVQRAVAEERLACTFSAVTSRAMPVAAITSPEELRSGTTLCSVQICVPSRRVMRSCNERTPSTPSCPSERTSSMSSSWVTLMISDGSS